MSDPARSSGYHSPAPQRHSSRSAPPSHQSFPQRQIRFGDRQSYFQPPVEDEEEEDAIEQDEPGEDEIGIEGVDQLRVNSVMAISAIKGRVGMCMYNHSDRKLLFIEDQQDSENWDLVTLGKARSTYGSIGSGAVGLTFEV